MSEAMISVAREVAAAIGCDVEDVWLAPSPRHPECLRGVVPDHEPAAGRLHAIAVAAGFARICFNVVEASDLPGLLHEADPFTAAFDVGIATIRS